MKELFSGVFIVEGKLSTRASFPDYRPFSERVNKGFREWDPERSKAAAAIMKGIKKFPILGGDKVLYLGIAHGYTASFLADIIGTEGIIYGVEFSERCFNELLPIAERYGNIVPMLADARFPEKYEGVEKVDIVYCDIADRQQTDIAIRNCKMYLKPNGFLMLAIKSRSIDVTASPKKIIGQEIEKVKSSGLEVIDWCMLDPFEKDHAMVIAKMI